MDVTRNIQYDGAAGLLPRLEADLTEAGCQVRLRQRPPAPGSAVITALVTATGTREAIQAGVDKFLSRDNGPRAFINHLHYSRGVVPGQQDPPFHAVDHQPTADAALCGTPGVTLLSGRFDMYDPRSCSRCVDEAWRR